MIKKICYRCLHYGIPLQKMMPVRKGAMSPKILTSVCGMCDCRIFFSEQAKEKGDE